MLAVGMLSEVSATIVLGSTRRCLTASSWRAAVAASVYSAHGRYWSIVTWLSDLHFSVCNYGRRCVCCPAFSCVLRLRHVIIWHYKRIPVDPTCQHLLLLLRHFQKSLKIFLTIWMKRYSICCNIRKLLTCSSLCNSTWLIFKCSLTSDKLSKELQLPSWFGLRKKDAQLEKQVAKSLLFWCNRQNTF